jgi:hypothetical protein
VEIVGTNIITNAATYGELPWRIYKTDLEERYKVLNALKVSRAWIDKIEYFRAIGQSSPAPDSWNVAKDTAESDYLAIVDSIKANGELPVCFIYTVGGLFGTTYGANIFNSGILSAPEFTCTNISFDIDNSGYIKADYVSTTNDIFCDNGLSLQRGAWKKITYPFGLPMTSIPEWPNEPVIEGWGVFKGLRFNFAVYADWNFQYCTNKYW